jgi:hypothetical protein
VRRLASLSPARRQRGAALIILVTVMVLGVTWFTVGALGKAAPTAASREIRTGEALQAGKKALLAYIAQYAARSDTARPGQLPCPESVTLAEVGEDPGSCAATGINVGRLPWKTLGIDQLRDGEDEPLWYVMRGFRNAPINFSTAGLLNHSGSTVVAMIIAPGRPRNTASLAGTLAGCTKQNQLVANRNSANLNAANFLECGVATGSVTSPGDPAWTNDRVIAITQAEWADAIAGPVADRMQRQVAPAIEDYRNITSNNSWGQRFLPNPSTFNTPPDSDDYCGDNNLPQGMPPTITVAASKASGICVTDWATYSVSGLGSLLSVGGCFGFPSASPPVVRCDFTVILGGFASPTINITAPNIGYSFRYIDTSKITIQVNGALGPYPTANTGNYTGSVSGSNGSGTFSFEVFFPFLTIASSVSIRVPYPEDALLVDTRSAWYLNNGWERFTYYGVARPATPSPGNCFPGGSTFSTRCLTVEGMAAPNNDKRFVLALIGPRAIAPQTWTNNGPDDYLEVENATPADRIYEARTVNSSFNDRIATCPFTYLDPTPPVVICN